MEQEDQLTREDILDELTWDARLGPLSVSVEVNEGHVTLTGVVPTVYERSAAERVVRESPNVLSVDNRLRISAEERLSDREITDELVRSLRRHPRLAEEDLEVSCEGAVVTVSGTVDSFWKRTRISDIVHEQPGVVDVVNEIAVAGGDITDEQLAHRVAELLRRKAGIDENTVAVEVDDGVATLRGTVPTWMVRSVAYETAANMEGIRDIVDEIDVDQR